MSRLGEKLNKELGPGSEFAVKVRKELEKEQKATKFKTPKTLKPLTSTNTATAKPKKATNRREARIQALESQIQALMAELKKLKTDDDEDEDQDDDNDNDDN